MKKSPEDLPVEQNALTKKGHKCRSYKQIQEKSLHISAQELNYLYPAQGTTLGGGRASSPTHDKELNLLIHSLSPVPPALRAGSARCRISTLSEIPAKIIAVWDSLACQDTLG